MSRSEEVRDFYERMPYRAPLTSLDAYRDLYKNRDRRRARVPSDLAVVDRKILLTIS